MARKPSEHLDAVDQICALALMGVDFSDLSESNAESLRYVRRLLSDVAEELRAEEARARHDDEAPRS